MSIPATPYLEALTVRALERYRTALPTATPIQKHVWHWHGRFEIFVDDQWPFDASPPVAAYVSRIMFHIVLKGLSIRDALRAVRRFDRMTVK